MNLKVLLVAIFLLSVPMTFGQDTEPSAKLFDTFGKSNGEMRSAKFDALFVQLQNDPASQAHIFVYCGKTCKYGEVESHIRGIELKIDGRKFDRTRIAILNGGFRETQEVEIWLQPAGAPAPLPTSKLNIKNVSFAKANAALIEPYDCCGSMTTQWNKFKPSN